MVQERNRIQLPLEEIKLAFAASCVEGTARKLGVSYIEIYDRMKKVDLINKFISSLEKNFLDFEEKKESLEEYFMSFYKEDLKYGGISQ